MTAPLLDITDLHLRFRVFEGVSHVLRDVALHMQPGERVGLVGESGCGKSVLLRAILGLLDKRAARLEGSIRFVDDDLVAASERQMRGIRGRRISMIFQDPASALNPVFTVGDQLVDIMLQHGAAPNAAAARTQAAQALRQVLIDDPERVLASYPFQLSGGMNQRVMITMALINRPLLVLADEPGTALDVTVQEQTLRLMRRLTEGAGTAVLLVTHNLGVVREFAERVYVMYAGTIVEQAPAAALFAAPLHPYTRALLAAVPRLTGEALPVPIAGMVPDFLSAPPGCRFAPRCPHATAACETPPPPVQVAPDHIVACTLYSA